MMAIIEKEKILLVSVDSIPLELQQLNNWVIWKAIEDKEKKQFNKVPYQPNGIDKAMSTVPETWSTFEEVVEAYENGIGEGIGFVLSEGDPYACIDIDGLKSVDELPALAQEIIDLSYAELSPSGTGIHIWVKYKHDNKKLKNKNTQLGYEIYSSKRFITFTGENINHLSINGDQRINGFIEKVFKREECVAIKGERNTSGSNFSETEIIQIAYKSKTGERFKKFMGGGWESSFSSPSEAELSFCNDLAFWTNCDFNMMDSIYRKSSLNREKWDSKRDNSTYGAITINKAIQDCKKTFQPKDKFSINKQGNENFVFPKGYFSENGCLYKEMEKKNRNGEVEVVTVFICRQTPIITRSFINVEHPQPFYELSWTDKGREYKETVPQGDLSTRKKLIDLSNKSLAVTDVNASELIQYFDKLNMINKHSPEPLVERLGHIKGAFIHPLISENVKILPPDVGEKQLIEAISVSGTTQEWITHVFNHIQKHPKALLMVLASFTSTILKDFHMKPFIIDLSGVTSQGKTTALRACASVWGNEYLVNEWNITKVAAERKSAFLNSFPLILDDTRKADKRQLQEFIYAFSGGRSKGRGSIAGSQKEFTWNNLMLSTGEASLNEYAELAGGVAARILPIKGLPFEGEGYQFFTNLYDGFERYYGSVGIDFLKHWDARKHDLKPFFHEYNEVFQKKSHGNEVVSRISRYYAAIVFTGRLLNEFFGLDIDLMQLYKYFDKLTEENKAVDKPLQMLETLLTDLDSDRSSIFGEYDPRKEIKAVYKNNTLYLLPNFLKEVLMSEQNTIRSEWLRREITMKRNEGTKFVDYQQIKHKGKKFRGIAIQPSVIEKLGFDFSES